MLEIRYDPIKRKKVAYATLRQGRTFHPPKDFCPLCPSKEGKSSTEIPDKDYDIVVFENRFPTFSPNAPEKTGDNFYKKYSSKGICEVVCYTSHHSSFIEDLPTSKIEKLILVWIDRYKTLSKNDYIKYILIFENKGKEIGVTLSHPHGQIYAFSYIPPIPEAELESSRLFFNKNRSCLHCKIIDREISEKIRIVIENDYFIGFIPYYASWPYEVHVYSKNHYQNLTFLKDKEVSSLAAVLKGIILKYNALFGMRMAYVMVIHQSPVNQGNYSYYHFHFEFYPPYRTSEKLKYIAGCELGAGTFINDTLPEEKAKELNRIDIYNPNLIEESRK